jgi:hypothetical protein
MRSIVLRRLPRGLLLLLALTLTLALMPLAHGHDIACAHDTSDACAGPGDRMDKGDSIFDPSAAPGRPGPQPAMVTDARRSGFELLGTFDPGQGSLGDVWSHKRTAYLASWVAECGQGIRAVDLRDPRNPTLVSTFADGAGEPDVAGAWTEKVIVQRVNTRHFKGDLAAVSFQNCSGRLGSGFRGFGVYDVTNPADPQRLALVPTGANGSHEIWLDARPQGAYVYTAVSNAERFSGNLAGNLPGEEKDFQIWDVSQPTTPVQVGDWGAWEQLDALPVENVPGEGNRSRFVHSVIGEGTDAYLSYWDLGTVILDVSDPSNPVYKGRTTFEPQEEGNAHSAALAQGGRLLIQTDEDFNPSPAGGREVAWGYPRFFALDRPDRDGLITPRRVGTFELPTTRQFPAPDDGDYTVHDPKVRGNTAFFSWYAEGIVAVDIAGVAQGREPQMIAQWKPPLPNTDPSGTLPDTAQVWGVALDGDLVLASDQNTGLYVLRLRRG